LDKAGPWLLVVDNADDLALVLGGQDKPGIVNYLPQSEHGIVLLTTRSAEVAEAVAGADVFELGDMDGKEVLDLLGNSVRRAGVLSDETATGELLRELAYLPLAITQAAAYLNRNKIPVTKYLQSLRGTEQDTIRLLSRQFHDSGRYRDMGRRHRTIGVKRGPAGVSCDRSSRIDGPPCACQVGDLNRVQSILETKLVNINVKAARDRTPLHEAAQRGHLEIVKLLLGHGADHSVKTVFGSTVLDLAKKFERDQVAWLLEDRD
jgi:hypothetical protein